MAKQKIYAKAPGMKQCLNVFEGMDCDGKRTRWHCKRYAGHTGPCQVPDREKMSQRAWDDQGIYTQRPPDYVGRVRAILIEALAELDELEKEA